jgi:MFS family permease
MKGLVKTLEGLPWLIRVLLTLFVGIYANLLRLFRSLAASNIIGIVLAVILVLTGMYFSYMCKSSYSNISFVFSSISSIALLIAPIITDFGVDAPMIWAICAAVCIFATTMVSWAILRTLAEISRMLREKRE